MPYSEDRPAVRILACGGCGYAAPLDQSEHAQRQSQSFLLCCPRCGASFPDYPQFPDAPPLPKMPAATLKPSR